MKRRRKINLYFTLTMVIIFLNAGCSLSPALIRDFPGNGREEYIVIGHRGAAGLAPENTLVAISKGLGNQAARIEIDVQQSKDGKVVLMHDESLDRTTNGTGFVKDFTYAQLSELDAGSWFGSSFQGEKIPTLEEAIKLVNGQSELIIEIKKGNEYYPNIEENILQIIERNQCSQWCIIHSFDSDILHRIHHKNPSLRLHKLLIGKFYFFPVMIDDGIEIFDIDDDPFIEEYSIHYRFANRAIIKKLQSKGKKVNVWTANSDDIIQDMISLGIDGIITDFPDKLTERR